EPGLLLLRVALERPDEMIPREVGLAPQPFEFALLGGTTRREGELDLVQLTANFEQLALKRLPFGRLLRLRVIERPNVTMALTSLRIWIDPKHDPSRSWRFENFTHPTRRRCRPRRLSPA